MLLVLRTVIFFPLTEIPRSAKVSGAICESPGFSWKNPGYLTSARNLYRAKFRHGIESKIKNVPTLFVRWLVEISDEEGKGSRLRKREETFMRRGSSLANGRQRIERIVPSRLVPIGRVAAPSHRRVGLGPAIDPRLPASAR